LRFRANGKRRHETLGTDREGWTEAKAQKELEYRLADVERGIWREPTPAPEPGGTFHVFASEWLGGIAQLVKADQMRPATLADYRWQLVSHLLPFFAKHRLDQITIAEVDRYRQEKVREGELAAESVNKTIVRLGQILEVASERELIGRNPVKVNPRNRKLKTRQPRRAYLDQADQISDLLSAAAELDAGARVDRRGTARKALLATFVLGGLRIGEALALRWRDVDLASGRLEVSAAKTDAGVRRLDLVPALRDELAAHKAYQSRGGRQADLVFGTETGGKQNPSNVRTRVLARAVKRANERRAQVNRHPLPERLTPHSLRKTFISVLFALGEDVPYVMAQVGHRDPKVTLGIYAEVMRRDEGEKDRLRALVGGDEKARMGATGSGPSSIRAIAEPIQAKETA